MRAANSIAGTDFETLTAKFCRIEQRIEPNPDLSDIYERALDAFILLLNNRMKEDAAP